MSKSTKRAREESEDEDSEAVRHANKKLKTSESSAKVTVKEEKTKTDKEKEKEKEKEKTKEKEKGKEKEKEKEKGKEKKGDKTSSKSKAKSSSSDSEDNMEVDAKKESSSNDDISAPKKDFEVGWDDSDEVEEKSGRFTQTEDEKLIAHLREYIELHFPNEDVDEYLQKLVDAKLGKKKTMIWETMKTHYFPDRSAKAIYDHVRRRFNKKNYGGAWTLEMKKQMRDLVEKYGTDFRKIGDIMGRIPGDCKDNWRKMQADYNSGSWSKEEDDKLVQLLTAMYNGEMPSRDISVPWTQVSKDLGTRSREQCYGRYLVLASLRNSSGSGESTRTFWSRTDDVTLLVKLWLQYPRDLSELRIARLSKKKHPSQVHYRVRKMLNLIIDSRVLPLRTTLKQLLKFYEVNDKKIQNLKAKEDFQSW